MLADITKSDISLYDELDDYIIGGAKVVNDICSTHLKVSKTQKCSCGLFEKRENGPIFDICDNCMWAESPYEGSEILFCSKIHIGKIGI